MSHEALSRLQLQSGIAEIHIYVWEQRHPIKRRRDDFCHEPQDAYGIENSAVSENLMEAGRERIKELTGRRLGELP